MSVAYLVAPDASSTAEDGLGQCRDEIRLDCECVDAIRHILF